MKISGFTIARDVIKYNYPVVESITSILPVCDEFIVNVGDSEDETLALIQSIKSDKVRIIQERWDLSLGKEVLSHQTNLALKECRGDWAFYLQSDEVVHEQDLGHIVAAMKKYLKDEKVDALRFRWFHFYASYYRYRIDYGWYQKQDRIIRNNGQVESFGDAYGFRRKDNWPLGRKNCGAFVYHYGWVQPQEVMAQRRINAENIGFVQLNEQERSSEYDYGRLKDHPIYFGTHPKVMAHLVETDQPSQKDLKEISRQWWWYPPKILKIRYKSGRRAKEGAK